MCVFLSATVKRILGLSSSGYTLGGATLSAQISYSAAAEDRAT